MTDFQAKQVWIKGIKVRLLKRFYAGFPLMYEELCVVCRDNFMRGGYEGWKRACDARQKARDSLKAQDTTDARYLG